MQICYLVLVFQVSSQVAVAQEAPANFENKNYSEVADETLFATWDGDFNAGQTAVRAQLESGNPITEEEARDSGAFIKYELIGEESALSVSINFSDFSLGSGSMIQIRGTESDTPQIQWFDQKTLTEWEGSTALFNGSYVGVFLFASADDPGAFYEISSVDIGQPATPRSSLSAESLQQQAIPGEEAICSADDRQRSSDNRMGRIMPVGCTGWMESGGKFLTAGHCAEGDRMKFLQFEVPSSNSDGTPNHPPVMNQYKIVSGSVEFRNGGIGNDWAVFDVATGLGQEIPHSRYGSFFLRRDDNATDVWVRGYGVDDEPSGAPPSLRNNDSQTQQEHFGPLAGVNVVSETNAVIKHRVDTRGGNSGSPIFLADDPNVAIGIHSHGGCNNASWSANHGTSFLNDALWGAIQN